MDRYRIPEIFLGCFLTVAVFATGMMFARQEQSGSPAQFVKKEEAFGHSQKPQNPDTELTGSTWLTKDAAGFFTFGLVVVAIGQAWLFLIQLRYMRNSMKDSTVAANAAKTSADSLSASERARFFIVIEQQNITEVVANVESRGTLASGENFSIKYRFKNYGKTPGIIKELVVDSMISTDPVDPPFLAIATKDFPEYMIGANSATKESWYSPVTPMHISQVQAIGRNTAHFWLYGRLYYDDVFGNHQVHKFYFRSTKAIGRSDVILQPCDYQDHNKST